MPESGRRLIVGQIPECPIPPNRRVRIIRSEHSVRQRDGMHPENHESAAALAANNSTSELLRAWCEHAEGSPMPIWIANSAGVPVHFNSGWKRFTHSTGNGELTAPTIHPHDVSAVQSACRQFALVQQPFHIEFRLCPSKGQYRWQSATGVPILKDRATVAGLVVTCIDIHARRPAESDHLHRPQLLRQMELLAKIGAWELDLTAMRPILSDEVCRIHEVEPGHQPTLETAISYYHPDARPIIAAAVQKAIEDGTPWDLELQFITARGRAIWVRAMGQVEDCDGPPQRLFGAFQDITERKLTELALRSSEDRFRTLIELGSDVFFMLTPAGNVVYLSPNCQRLLGYTSTELMGQPFELLVHADDAARCHDFAASLIATGTSGCIEFRLRHQDGTFRWRSCTASAMPAGPDGQTMIVGAACDVTERRQAQESVAASRELFQMVTDSLEDFISVATPQRTSVFLSPSCFRMLGYTSEEFLISDFATRVHPDDLPRVEAARLQNLQGQTTRIEWRCRHREGHYLWMETSANPVQEANGKVTFIVCCSRDITERKRLEAEFRQFTRELEASHAQIEQQSAELRAVNLQASAANRAKSEFLANMSHELRTPMTSVLGFADLLLTDDDWSHSPENRTRAIQAIRRNGEHLLTIINDILDLSKIEAGMMMVESVPTSVRHLVADLVGTFQFRANEKGLSLSAECAADVPEYITTDPTRLRQIVVNLVGNAIKFTETGGIRIVVRSVAESLTAEAQLPMKLMFEVIDSGIGIDPEHVSRLFQPFTQADSSTSRRFGGTGLGLTISKRMAEMLDGNLTVTSELGRGSSFVATIAVGHCDALRPTTRNFLEPAQQQIAAAPRVYPSLNGCRILLAEDGLDNQRLIAFLLQKSGAEVMIADNGRVAVDLVSVSRGGGPAIDLILMDMQMPILDGYSATRELRQCGDLTPIIALTANTMSGDRQLCLDAGCDDYLAKPIDRAALIEMVAQWHAKGERQTSNAPDHALAPSADAL